MSSHPPRSTRELSDEAVKFKYNHLIPLRFWLRSADSLAKEASVYLAEENDEQAYFLLIRHAELVLQYLPYHPEVNDLDKHQHLRRATDRALDSLRKLEQIKPRIQARYDAYQQSLLVQEQARRYSAGPPGAQSSPPVPGRTRKTPKPLDLTRRMSSSSLPGPFSPPLGRNMTPPTPKSPGGSLQQQQQSLALEIARQEFENREREKRERRMRAALEAGRNIPLDSTGAEIRRVATPRYDHQPSRIISTEEWKQLEEEDDLARSIRALNMHPGLEPQQMRPPPPSRPPTDRDLRSGVGDFDVSLIPRAYEHYDNQLPAERQNQYSYPTVSRPSPSPIKYEPPPPPYPPYKPHSPSAMPPPPPKMPLQTERLPPPPPKVALSPVEPAPPQPPKPPKESVREFVSSASLEDGTPLRTIFLPASLRHTFLQIAAPNTVRNFETCGILCGTLIRNAFFISRLVIPEQDATSDTCAMKDEEGLFEYCNIEELMVLGWIHTHPTQTCFMSSVDLHTHAGFQWQLKESIAIVCAPRHEPDWGVFRLTDPPGVKVIGECTEKGLFHPHKVDGIYTDAIRPGHVVEAKEMGFDVVDLRKV